MFATTTKRNPDPIQGIHGLRRAVEVAGTIPVVAIGGITPARARGIYAARATSICAISAVNAAPDVAAAARAFEHRSPWLKNTGAYTALRCYPAMLHDE